MDKMFKIRGAKQYKFKNLSTPYWSTTFWRVNIYGGYE